MDILSPLFIHLLMDICIISTFWVLWTCSNDHWQQFSLIAQLYPTLRPHGLQHTGPPCSSPIPGTCSNSCPWSWWCLPTISSSVISFSSCLQSWPASGSFPMSQLFALGGQSSSGHRTGKGQFSFQSQRKAMPKNAQTTTQLHSSHMLVK